ncbi:MAG: winged helix-turn-helix transcriptional regulator [Bacteroides sp.]|nr:winged helix-turn-helix transcriptional regulator [Bacteroides sp.]
MFSQTARALERDGLMRREVFPVVPPGVEYSLTQMGRFRNSFNYANGLLGRINWRVYRIIIPKRTVVNRCRTASIDATQKKAYFQL